MNVVAPNWTVFLNTMLSHQYYVPLDIPFKIFFFQHVKLVSSFILISASSASASTTAAPLLSGASLRVLRSVTRVTLSECFLGAM